MVTSITSIVANISIVTSTIITVIIAITLSTIIVETDSLRRTKS